MKKINNILSNYIFLNLISVTSILYILLLIIHIFMYLLRPDDVDSFDVYYGIFMNFSKISDPVITLLKAFFILFVFEII